MTRPGEGHMDVPGGRPKYSLPEIERRWFVDVSALPVLDDVPYQDIEDLYVNGTSLRLRKVTDQGGAKTFKLGKKYAPVGRYEAPITNLYLSAAEYEALKRALSGDWLRKRRYLLMGGALDVPEGDLAPIFSIEFRDATEAAAYVPPWFTGPEAE